MYYWSSKNSSVCFLLIFISDLSNHQSFHCWILSLVRIDQLFLFISQRAYVLKIHAWNLSLTHAGTRFMGMEMFYLLRFNGSIKSVLIQCRNRSFSIRKISNSVNSQSSTTIQFIQHVKPTIGLLLFANYSSRFDSTHEKLSIYTLPDNHPVYFHELLCCRCSSERWW